ncbi:PH domain-containing protein [Halovenus sp. WSH3]|uniref:PH domain-containing protein n=1 Tax=Halovenus carboxidivorans TaxID=2692199 RepID=A0A6B0T0B6_9EURY|nr:PH domain-containing protein [Halovenus carboxidivorans]MXR51265.1 PH domain-containing protein [Halovenus carboxidivorans]
MTDGGDGVSGDGPDRLSEDRGERTAPQSPTPRVDSTGSESQGTQRPADHSTPDSSTDRLSNSNAAPESPLAEPTRGRLAREQARATGLERGPISEYTTERRSLDSAVQIQWASRAVILAAVLGAILTGALAGLDAPVQFGLVGIGVLVALSVVWVVMSYRIWCYQIRDDSLYLERGVVTHVRTIVPYVRIQHVDTSRSALERALGLSTLVVYTAGSRGADVSVPGLKPDEARDLQQRLKELAIEADGDDAL